MTALAPSAPGTLDALDKLRVLLDRAETVGDLKSVKARAEALRYAAEQAGAGLEAQNHCAEVKLRAERKAGDLLARMGLKTGPKAIGDTLSSIGVLPHQSSRWQKVAALPESEFEAYIAAAFNESRELTTAGALKLVKQVTAADPAKRPPLHVVEGPGLAGLTGTFNTVVADPPWQYDNKATRGAAEDHYPTLSVAELCALDVAIHVGADAHLYLWTTNGFLRDAFDVLTAWGFTYKAHLAWVKPQMGMGNYFRISYEHVLFGVRGRLPIEKRNLMSWFEAPRGQHSSKPDCFYDLVESASPGPYLDMFARRRRLGEWTTWGNEA